MGEWHKVVPSSKSEGFVYAVVSAGALITVQVLTWTGNWGPLWTTVFVSAFLVLATISWWRTARAGVYIGPRGVLLYYWTRRAEVVPWDEVVRFDARPLRLPALRKDGMVIDLVRRLGDTRPTPFMLSSGTRYDWAYPTPYSVDIPSDAFFEAVHTLNDAVHPSCRPR